MAWSTCDRLAMAAMSPGLRQSAASKSASASAERPSICSALARPCSAMKSAPASRTCSNSCRASAALPSDSKSSPSSIRAMFAPLMALPGCSISRNLLQGAPIWKGPARQLRRVPRSDDSRKEKGSRCREPLSLPWPLFLVREADADTVHAANHVIQIVAGVLATGIRRVGVGDVIDIGIELDLVADVPVGTQVEVQDRIDLVEVDGRRLDGRRRAGAGSAGQCVAVGEHAAGVPTLRQVEAPDIGLVALGFQQLPVQHVTAGLVVGRAAAAAAQRTGQFDIPLGARDAAVGDVLA